MSNYEFIRQGKGRIVKRGEGKDRKPYTVLVMKTGEWTGWTVKVQKEGAHLWARKVTPDPWNPDDYNEVPGESWKMADPIVRVTKTEKRYSYLVKFSVWLAQGSPSRSVLVQTVRERAKPKACAPESRGGLGLTPPNYYAQFNAFLGTVGAGLEPSLRLEGANGKDVLVLTATDPVPSVPIANQTPKTTITPSPQPVQN